MEQDDHRLDKLNYEMMKFIEEKGSITEEKIDEIWGRILDEEIPF